MLYMEERLLIHRDLAARNILVQNLSCIKISDFGLTKQLSKQDEEYDASKEDRMLPVKWMAIESLENLTFSTKTDVWAYGITVWEILTWGNTPYIDISENNIFSYLSNDSRLSKPNICKENMYSLLETCWDNNPKIRPKFGEILVKIQKMTKNPHQYLHCPLDYPTFSFSNNPQESTLEALNTSPQYSCLDQVKYLGKFKQLSANYNGSLFSKINYVYIVVYVKKGNIPAACSKLILTIKMRTRVIIVDICVHS